MTAKDNLDDTYVVQQGDTLSSIARKRKIPVGELKKINNLATDLIDPEQILIIPKK